MIFEKITVNDVHAIKTLNKRIPAGIIGAQVQFEFGPMWGDLTKTAVFKGCCTKDVLNIGDTVTIPAEVIAKPCNLQIGIYGVDGNGNATPTFWTSRILVCDATDPSGDTTTDPSLPVWAQLHTDVEQLKQQGGGTVDEATVQKIVEDYLTANPPAAGAQPDWNAAEGEPGHILNRICYEENAFEPIAWDGNTDGLESLSLSYINVYKVCNDYISISDISDIAGIVLTIIVGAESAEQPFPAEQAGIYIGDHGWYMAEGLVISSDGQFEIGGITIPNGVWIGRMEDGNQVYWISKVIPNVVSVPIEKKYLPDDIRSLPDVVAETTDALNKKIVSASYSIPPYMWYGRDDISGITSFANTGITVIGKYAFCKCSSLALEYLPGTVAEIGELAFDKCTNLSLKDLPRSLTRIEFCTFRDCTNLALTSLPYGISYIGSGAFSGCTKLALTWLPSTVNTIAQGAFRDCVGITKMEFSGTPTFIDSEAFSGCENLLTINVPWAEGEVANAPWGATNATINYNARV